MPSAAVLDTHALVFHAADGRRLGRRAAAHFEACEGHLAIAYVPAAVLWELSGLVRRGRVRFGVSVREFCSMLFSNPAYQPLDLTPEQVFIADEVRPNEDPFDALVCAAALSLDLPLITRDREIERSGMVETLWD